MPESSGRSIEEQEALEALRALAMPVALVTATAGDERATSTATVMYASLRPLAVAIAMHAGSRTQRLVDRAGRFSVSLLTTEDVDLAGRAGRSISDPDAFRTLGIDPVQRPDDPTAPAGYEGALAVLWCTVQQRTRVGDHWLYTAVVDGGRRHVGDRLPLLRYAQTYHGLGSPVADTRVDGYPL